MNFHKEFVKLGREKNRIQYKLLYLLPKIFESGEYRQYCRTIQGYAWRFAQIPGSVVEKTLRLEKYLEGKPCLKEAVATVGVHKVALLASIATTETDELFADKVRNMSKPAVQELAKELRSKEFGICHGESEGGSGLILASVSINCCAVPTNIKIELDSEMTFLFLQLKKKYGGTNQEVMMRILREANGVEAQKVNTLKLKKAKISSAVKGKRSAGKLSPGTTFHEAQPSSNDRAFIRYIRKSIREKALEESNHRCAYPGCNKPPDVNHHPERFSETGNHQNIKPMCKLHHEFAHNGLIECETEEPEKWRLKLNRNLNHADQLYRKYRQGALS